MASSQTTAELWDGFATSLRSWFRARGASMEDAEDLLSETFVRVHEGVHAVTDAERYAGWIQRIARNVWTDALRASQPREELEEPVDAEPDVGFAREVASWLAPMLDQLEDETTRTILKRTDLGGETQAAVARDLKLSLPALKARVRRGRHKLRSVLEDCCSFEFDRRGALIDATRKAGACGCASPSGCSDDA